MIWFSPWQYNTGGFSEQYGTVFATPGVAEKGSMNVELDVSTPGGHSSVPPEHTVSEPLWISPKHPKRSIEHRRSFRTFGSSREPSFRSSHCESLTVVLLYILFFSISISISLGPLDIYLPALPMFRWIWHYTPFSSSECNQTVRGFWWSTPRCWEHSFPKPSV